MEPLLRFGAHEGHEHARSGVRRGEHAGAVRTISRFYGIVIRMYFADHAPPHFHAVYAGQEAVVAIADGEILRGGRPDRALRMVREWASMHRGEWDTNWDRTQVPEQPAPDRAAAMTASRTTITQVEPLAERWVRLPFGDGAVHEVDLAGLLSAGGVFASIRDQREVFEAVAVDHEFGTIVWPDDVDLDPDVLRGDQPPASGRTLPRRVIQPA